MKCIARIGNVLGQVLILRRSETHEHTVISVIWITHVKGKAFAENEKYKVLGA